MMNVSPASAGLFLFTTVCRLSIDLSVCLQDANPNDKTLSRCTDSFLPSVDTIQLC